MPFYSEFFKYLVGQSGIGKYHSKLLVVVLSKLLDELLN